MSGLSGELSRPGHALVGTVGVSGLDVVGGLAEFVGRGGPQVLGAGPAGISVGPRVALRRLVPVLGAGRWVVYSGRPVKSGDVVGVWLVAVHATLLHTGYQLNNFGGV